MSEYVFWTERHKNRVGTYEVGQNQENVYTHMQNVKVADNKHDARRRKGLSENCATRTTASKFVIGKAPFDVYQDDSDENLRSRSRVRKDTCKRELKVKREHGTVERISANAAKLVTENGSVTSPALRIVSRRARSSSNTRKQTVDRRSNELLGGNKYFLRSNSESRRTVSQHVQHDASKATSSQVKNLLSNKVKKRTFSSIQMWKDKMRNQHTGTLPKSFENAHSNVSNRMHTKIKSRKNSILDRTVLHHRSNSANSIHLNNFTDKVWQNQPINPNENVKEQIEKQKDTPEETETSINSRLKTIVKSSNEIAAYLGSKELLNVETNVVASLDSEDNQDNQLQDASSSSIFMIPDVSTMLLASVKKMRYEKREEQRNFKKRDEENDVYQIPHECYLDDILDTERKKEEHAPKLSSRFLHENVNAEQRRVIVGYLIHVSVHCNYSSHIIYQTVKLFDVIVDRIFVKTDNIQLIALACLWINLKKDATFKNIPSATTILELAKDMYIGQEKQLLIYEKKILLTVNFNICFTDSFSLLFYYIWCVNEDAIINPHDIMLIYFCGSYLIDVTMLNEHLCDISGCMLAMAAAELSLNLVYLDDINITTRRWRDSWRNKYRLTEWEERAVSRAKQNMMRQVLESKNREFSLNVVYKKYLRSKHGRISNFLISRMQKLTQGRYSNDFF